jgi:hypothetical protein
MARAQSVTQTGTGQTAGQILNTAISAFHVGICLTVTGSVSYTIEVTNSDFTTVGNTPNWFTFLATQTTSQTLAINTPFRAWRINNASGSGSILAEAVQSGITDM